MNQGEKDKIDSWLEEEVVEKYNHIWTKLNSYFTPEKTENIMPTVLQLSVKPYYYHKKDARKGKDELIAKLKEKLKEQDNLKKFTSFVQDNEINYKAGAKPLDVARSMSKEMLKEALETM
ncbi:MAG: hypothetical protein ACOC85_05560 [Thermoplasmatota archaeon]